MRFVLASGVPLELGVETVEIEGVEVRIYNPAKCVVDCFRYRRHVGLEVTVEAVRETLRQRRPTASEINKYARKCRIGSVIRPYLEAVA